MVGPIPISLLLCTSLLLGCLIPLPLDPAAPPDGGQILEVIGASPAFGTQRAMSSLDPFNYEVDVASDSPAVAGRLYAQLNGSCCDLNVEDPKATFFHQRGETIQVGTGTGTTSRYTIDFRQTVLPCTLGFSGSIVYLVPVLATGGFQDDGPTGFRPDGIGIVDHSHYWTIICPP